VKGMASMSQPPAAELWDGIYARSEIPLELDAGAEGIIARALAFFGDVAGKTVVDLGCGRGEYSIYLARRSAQVIALDTSEVAIERLRDFCRRNSLANVTPVCASALEIEKVGKFDFIFGTMILHHIEPFEDFARALKRALNVGGKGFFHENSAMSRLMMWGREHVAGRLWIPKFGDPDEYPLTPQEVDCLKRYFRARVEYPEMYLFQLVLAYLSRNKLVKLGAAIDRFLYRNRLFLKYSYRQDVLLENATVR
jgi:cyclopropane fatty-acyl-phospholipid synthase-like methyltransferase